MHVSKLNATAFVFTCFWLGMNGVACIKNSSAYCRTSSVGAEVIVVPVIQSGIFFSFAELGVVTGTNRVAEADRCIGLGVGSDEEEGLMRFPNENFFFFSDFGAASVLRDVSLSSPVNLERLFPRDMGLADSSLVPCVDDALPWV